MKVAICYSGETRSFNQVGKYDLKKLIEAFNDFGHDVDCYGVHWDDCEYPDQDVVEFKEIKTISQQIIRDWVEADLPGRAIVNNAYAYNRFSDMYNLDFNKIPHDELVYSTFTSLGQVIGGWLSLQMPKDTYDLYIRWRWDGCLSLEPNKAYDSYAKGFGRNIIMQHLLYLCIAKFEDLANRSGWIGGSDGINMLTSPNSLIRHKYITLDDPFIVFNPEIKRNIDNLDVWDYFSKFLGSYKDFTNRPDTHGLWSEPLIRDLGAMVSFYPLQLFGFHRLDHLQTSAGRYQSYWEKYEKIYGTTLTR